MSAGEERNLRLLGDGGGGADPGAAQAEQRANPTGREKDDSGLVRKLREGRRGAPDDATAAHAGYELRKGL